ncbi:Cation/H+ exchanger [Rhodocollybia butyracea]|uniref:Cation/H+ exchanger n=1 Tax=Rhodocollybia butyracea TaxID=206335 RepID=A0A9P5Q8E4_9AGAR|nr:Cation/H+ exchanger [Rhodocollybia butyracea]
MKSQIFTYNLPDIPTLLAVSSFLYLINVAEAIFDRILKAGLLGSLVVGIIYGPEVADILPGDVLQALLILGYIGLILSVFEAGLSTDISLLYSNIAISILVGGTGMLLPIAFSIILIHFGFGYSLLQGFAAGASLSSTSLGTTLALLNPELRQSRTGVILLSAALFDDVFGLIIAAIIQTFSSSPTGSIPWQAFVRPILVSVAFAFFTGILAWAIQHIIKRIPDKWRRFAYQANTQLLFLVAVISGFVAGANYAGTSELFGAYLAGVLLSQIFHTPFENVQSTETVESRVTPVANSTAMVSPQFAFAIFIQPVLAHVFSPIFFATIGAALPIRSLAKVDGSSRVVWRGFVYALLMAVAKFLTGIWLLVPFRTLMKAFRQVFRKRNQSSDENLTTSRPSSAILLGLAMIARGEIALIVSQLSRSLLTEVSQELYAIVIWAILLDTVGGALGVGITLRRDAKLFT